MQEKKFYYCKIILLKQNLDNYGNGKVVCNLIIWEIIKEGRIKFIGNNWCLQWFHYSKCFAFIGI